MGLSPPCNRQAALVCALLLVAIAGVFSPLHRSFLLRRPLLVHNDALPPLGAAVPLAVARVETIHVAITACGVPKEADTYYGLLFFKSVLLTRANGADPQRRIHFHIITDVALDTLLNTTTGGPLNAAVAAYIHADPTLALSLHMITDVDDAAAGVEGDAALPHDIFKKCAATRLRLAFLLTDVSRLLYVDWDAVTMCDISLLWEAWGDVTFGWWSPTASVSGGSGSGPGERASGGGGGTALMAMALNDASGASTKDVYRINDTPHPRGGGVNSGVMLMHLEGIRAVGATYVSALRDVIAARVPPPWRRSGGSSDSFPALSAAFPLGDQDILNALFAPGARPEWLTRKALPPRWNTCLELFVPLDELTRVGHTRTLPCITHFCGQWLSVAHLDVEGSPSPTSGRALWVYFVQVLLTPPRVMGHREKK